MIIHFGPQPTNSDSRELFSMKLFVYIDGRKIDSGMVASPVSVPICLNMTENIGIKHGFPCINVCQVPREMLKTEAVGRGFQHLPRDRANVNVLENHV